MPQVYACNSSIEKPLKQISRGPSLRVLPSSSGDNFPEILPGFFAGMPFSPQLLGGELWVATFVFWRSLQELHPGWQSAGLLGSKETWLQWGMKLLNITNWTFASLNSGPPCSQHYQRDQRVRSQRCSATDAAHWQPLQPLNWRWHRQSAWWNNICGSAELKDCL